MNGMLSSRARASSRAGSFSATRTSSGVRRLRPASRAEGRLPLRRARAAGWSCRRGCRRARLVPARPAPGRRPEDARPLLLGSCSSPAPAGRSPPSVCRCRGRLPSAAVLLLLAVAGFFAPTSCCGRRSSDGAGRSSSTCPRRSRSSRSRFEPASRSGRRSKLAARDCPGPLGEELTRALSLAPRERSLGEREALVRVAREAGEPTFARFAELLAAKESPYLDFLQQQAREARRAEPLPGARRRPRLPRHARAGRAAPGRARAAARLRLPSFPRPVRLTMKG